MSGAFDRAAARRTRRLRTWSIVVLAVLAFGAAPFGAFVFDDIHSIAANPALRDAGHWWRWFADPDAYSTAGRMFRPLVTATLGVQYLVSEAPAWFKGGNLALHALVAVLVLRWLRRFGLRASSSWAVAALFAVHPLVSENINLVSARSELLLYVGAMVALDAHLGLCRGRSSWRARAGVLVGVAIACGSKETGVVLPGLLLAQAFLTRRAPWRAADWGRAVRVLLPAVALVGCYLLLRRDLLGEATVTLSGRAGNDPMSGHGRSLTCQLATMGLLLPRALFQMVFPVGLSLDPAVSFRQSLADPVVLLGWSSTLGLLLLGLLPGPHASARRFGVVWTVATALPWVVIPLNVPLAEHRLYGPLLGMLVIAAPWLPRPGGRPLAVAGLLLVGIVQSNARSLDYRDEVRLWEAELARADTWRAHWGLGAAYLRRGEFAAAVGPLTEAHHRNPRQVTVIRNLAEALTSLPDAQAEPERALQIARRFVAARPDDPWARTVLAQACLRYGRSSGDRSALLEAERVALSCLEVAEPKGYVYWLAAAARRALGDELGALAHLDASIARGLDYTRVRLERAAVLRALGRDREARDELMRAQRRAPLDPSVLRALRAAAPGR